MARKPSAGAAKKPTGKKLTLTRETVRDLAAGRKDVKGGAAGTTYTMSRLCSAACP